MGLNTFNPIDFAVSTSSGRKLKEVFKLKKSRGFADELLNLVDSL